MSFDILIKNGNIVDGTGNPSFRGDIGIIDDTVKIIKHRITEDAIRDLDASGKIVCPGFIDIDRGYGIFVSEPFICEP